jgi:hypothetical protein
VLGYKRDAVEQASAPAAARVARLGRVIRHVLSPGAVSRVSLTWPLGRYRKEFEPVAAAMEGRNAS